MVFTSRLVIFLFYLPVFIACATGNKKPVKLTYEVKASPYYPLKLMITYRDSCGDVTFTTTKTKWAKEVTLPPASLASLLVTIVYDSNNLSLYESNENSDPPERSYKHPLLSGKIISANDTIVEYHDHIIMISMFVLETR